MSNFDSEKQNKLTEIDNKYNDECEKEKDNYSKIKLNTEKELGNELTKNENNYKYEINEINKKYEKEKNEQKIKFENNKEKINDRYKKINENNITNHNKRLELLESNKKREYNIIENSFKQKMEQIKELLKINEIIYNTYNKNKDNYFYNKNIMNLLINYYKNENETIKQLENNEDFMETIKQKDYEVMKSKDDILLNLDIKKNEKDEEIIKPKMSDFENEDDIVKINSCDPKLINNNNEKNEEKENKNHHKNNSETNIFDSKKSHLIDNNSSNNIGKDSNDSNNSNQIYSTRTYDPRNYILNKSFYYNDIQAFNRATYVSKTNKPNIYN